MRLLYLAGLAYIGVTLFVVMRGPVDVSHATLTHVTPAGNAPGGAGWFQRVKSSCNALEVETLHRHDPPPTGVDGTGYSAACWAIAGRIDEARNQILSLPKDDHWKAAGIVFGVGHPIADMGDDLSAGPIMELVIEFWPNHYMALYHAGAARYALGDYDLADGHLEAFLQHYDQNDGWTASAKSMLKAIANR